MRKEPEFILVNMEKARELTKLNYPERVVLANIIERSRYDRDYKGLIVFLNLPVKRVIQERTGWKNVAQVDNALIKLAKSGVVIRVDRGVYQLNPEIFVRKGGSKYA